MTWHQTTMDRTLGKNSSVLQSFERCRMTQNKTSSLWFVNQTCPLEFAEKLFKKQKVLAFACIHICSSMQAWERFFFLQPQSMSGHNPVRFSCQKISFSFPASPSVQIFYFINMFKHFGVLLGVIWERTFILLRLAFFYVKIFSPLCAFQVAKTCSPL